MERSEESILPTVCSSISARPSGQIFSAGWLGIGTAIFGGLRRCLARGDLRQSGLLTFPKRQKDQQREEGRSRSLAESLRYSEDTVNMEQPEILPGVAAFLALRTELIRDILIERTIHERE